MTERVPIESAVTKSKGKSQDCVCNSKWQKNKTFIFAKCECIFVIFAIHSLAHSLTQKNLNNKKPGINFILVHIVMSFFIIKFSVLLWSLFYHVHFISFHCGLFIFFFIVPIFGVNCCNNSNIVHFHLNRVLWITVIWNS